MDATPAPVTLTIDAMPTTLDVFKALRTRIATTPEGGAAMFTIALLTYSTNPELGVQFLGAALDLSQLSGDLPTGLRDFRDRNLARPYIARSMIQGTSPETEYALPPLPYTIAFGKTASYAKEDDVRVYIATTGAPSPKPLRLRRNDKGIWKAMEWSSFQGNCKPPAMKITDDR